MIHYLPNMLRIAFKNAKINFKVHQSPDGWLGIVECPMTGLEYKFYLEPINSKVEIEEADIKKIKSVNILNEEIVLCDDLLNQGGIHVQGD